MSTEVVMPQMGESIAEGTITRWLKKVGEHVERDEPLFEISTDKVDAEIPSPAAGTLTEVRFKEGDTVEVNTVVAVLGGDGAASPTAPTQTAQTQSPVESPSVEQAKTVSEKNAQATTPPAPAVAPAPQTPAQRSEPVTRRVSAEPEVKPPSPKASAETEARQTEGRPTSPKASAETEARPATRKPPAPPSPPAQPQADGTSGSSVEELRRAKSSPLVRKIAEEHGVDITKLEGTGLSGRVTKNDILSFIESGVVSAPADEKPEVPAVAATRTQEVPMPPQVRPSEGDRVEQMSVMRKKIAEHMVQSRRTSAHVTTVYEIDMSRVARLRQQHKDSFLERTGTKLTYMPFIFQAVISALRKFPIFNAQVSGEQIVYKRDINLGMAVALDWGLIVPVIKRADDLSLSGLARAANDLAERARTKQLKPDEVTGGTFTITNPGVFGGLFGTPIINQPQLAILGIGKIEKRPRVMTTSEGDDYIAIRWMSFFALSFDHRIIDGADAERFLAYIKEVLEAAEFSV